MKRFCKLFLVIFCIFLITVFFTSCSTSFEEKITNSISETREHFYVAMRDDVYASFTDGMREKDFVMDGISTPLVAYGVLVVKTSENLGDNPQFTLKVLDKEYTGKLEINPYDNTYVADIGEKIYNCSEIILFVEGFIESLVLELISSTWSVTPTKALNTFIQFNKQRLENIYDGGSSGEIYIKLVTDREKVYYYILAVSNDGEVIGSLIDVATGEIVQKVRN